MPNVTNTKDTDTTGTTVTVTTVLPKLKIATGATTVMTGWVTPVLPKVAGTMEMDVIVGGAISMTIGKTTAITVD